MPIALDLSRQNQPENIHLLRASTVAYRKAKAGEIRVTYFLLALGIAYPVCYLFIQSQSFKLMLFGCSFLITVLVQIFTGWFYDNTARGALFKEEFDTRIFRLPWKTTLKRPDESEILHFSNQYRGVEIRDWYSPQLSSAIEHNIAVAILQYSNTSWDIALRQRYRKFLLYFLIAYSIVLILLFAILQVDFLTIFLLLFSVLSVFTHFIGIIRGHTGAIERRMAIASRLDEIIHRKRPVETQELRDIQDEIYLTRKESAKVPNFFFRMYKERMNADAERYIRDVNALQVE